MGPLKLKAPAKINLCLKILGRRPDSYHNLSMLMEKISLFDELVLEEIPSGIELNDSATGIPIEKNLVYQTARALEKASDTFQGGGAKRCRTPFRGVRIHLAKNIPMGGGLGGGSSDAATVLKGLNQLWELNWPVEKLAEVGVKLGADVPFFLYDGPAKVEGIGEKITPERKLPKLWVILVNPGIPVSTQWAYTTWDTTGCQAPGGTKVNVLTQENHSVSVPALRSFSEGGPRTFEELIKLLHNDFEEVVFAKFGEIKEAKQKLLEAGAAGALMSGSGATVFGLFETKEKRDRAQKKLKMRSNWQVFIAENVT